MSSFHIFTYSTTGADPGEVSSSELFKSMIPIVTRSLDTEQLEKLVKENKLSIYTTMNIEMGRKFWDSWGALLTYTAHSLVKRVITG